MMTLLLGGSVLELFVDSVWLGMSEGTMDGANDANLDGTEEGKFVELL